MRTKPNKGWKVAQIDLFHKLKQLASLNLEGTRDMKWAELYEGAEGKGLTQQEIADVHGCSRTLVVFRLRFGRFLKWIVTVVTLPTPEGLTEGRFRNAWAESGKGNESVRFKRCLVALAVPFKKNDISAKLKKVYGDGEKFTPEQAATELKLPLESVKETLRKMENGKIQNCRVKSRLAGKTRSYRIHEVFEKQEKFTARDYAELLADIDKAHKGCLGVVVGSTWVRSSIETVVAALGEVTKVLDAARLKLEGEVVDIKKSKTSSKP